MLKEQRAVMAPVGGTRPVNMLGDRLELCSINPMTGFFRDGCCDTGRETSVGTRSPPS